MIAGPWILKNHADYRAPGEATRVVTRFITRSFCLFYRSGKISKKRVASFAFFCKTKQ